MGQGMKGSSGVGMTLGMTKEWPRPYTEVGMEGERISSCKSMLALHKGRRAC